MAFLACELGMAQFVAQLAMDNFPLLHCENGVVRGAAEMLAVGNVSL